MNASWNVLRSLGTSLCAAALLFACSGADPTPEPEPQGQTSDPLTAGNYCGGAAVPCGGSLCCSGGSICCSSKVYWQGTASTYYFCETNGACPSLE